MEMARFVESLESDVAAVAAVGDEQTRAAAERVLQAIRGSAGLRLLDALGEAALEISAQLPAGHVEVRLAARTRRSCTSARRKLLRSRRPRMA